MFGILEIPPVLNFSPTKFTTMYTYVTFKEYCTEKGAIGINPVIRTNLNGYPFLTVLLPGEKKNEGDNIYFSKSAAADLTEGEVLSVEKLRTLFVAHSTNEKGEPRLKLTWNRGEYIDINDIW
jgi:hypothetical protein